MVQQKNNVDSTPPLSGGDANTVSAREQQIMHRVSTLRAELATAVNDLEKDSTASANDLAADLKRRQESYIRRERAYEEKIAAMEEELERHRSGRSQWMENDERVKNIREMYSKLTLNVEHIRENTARVLKDQEKDLLRAFRARLFDIQNELELEKNKADVGVSSWVEKNRQLERGLDWAKEMADRLERVNQALQRENQKLKSESKTQESDREFLIRQLVTVKKDNAQLRMELEGKEELITKQKEEIEELLLFKKQSRTSQVGTASTASLPGIPGRLGSEPSVTMQPSASVTSLPQQAKGSADTDLRYQEIIKRLKKLLDSERSSLRKVRNAYAADLKTRTELEIMLRQVVEDVRVNIVKQRKLQLLRPQHSHVTDSISHPASKSTVLADSSLPESDLLQPDVLDASEFTADDREKVLELLLSQERVVSQLYKKTFPSTRSVPSTIAGSSSAESPS